MPSNNLCNGKSNSVVKVHKCSLEKQHPCGINMSLAFLQLPLLHNAIVIQLLFHLEQIIRDREIWKARYSSIEAVGTHYKLKNPGASFPK